MTSTGPYRMTCCALLKVTAAAVGRYAPASLGGCQKPPAAHGGTSPARRLGEPGVLQRGEPLGDRRKGIPAPCRLQGGLDASAPCPGHDGSAGASCLRCSRREACRPAADPQRPVRSHAGGTELLRAAHSSHKRHSPRCLWGGCQGRLTAVQAPHRPGTRSCTGTTKAGLAWVGLGIAPAICARFQRSAAGQFGV